MIAETIEGILTQNIQLLVLGVGSSHYQNLFADLENSHPDKIRILPNNDLSRRKIYAASNIGLLFSKNTTSSLELKNLLVYGVIPVALPDPILENYNPVTEKGNAFLFTETNKWHFFGAFMRALENYKFSYDWQNLELAGMETLED